MHFELDYRTVDNVVSAITKIEKALDPSVNVEDVPTLSVSEFRSIRLLHHVLSKRRQEGLDVLRYD